MPDSSETPSAPSSTPRRTTPLFLSGESPRDNESSGGERQGQVPPPEQSSAERFSVPKMGSEVGYQVVSDDDVPPMRASGLVCLGLGLLSFSAILAWQMLIFPIAAIFFGMIALRRWSGRRPAGVAAAAVGLALASGFGALGVTIPMAKRMTLGNQAEYFAREFLEVVGNGDMELAMELQKSVQDRQVKEMNLEMAYEKDEIAHESIEETSTSKIMSDILSAGPDVPWELAEPVRVYAKYNVDRVNTYWLDPSGQVEGKVQVELQWTPDEETGVANWHVDRFGFYHEPVVAPSI